MQWRARCSRCCSATRRSRTSSPFWAWTSCPKIERFLSQPFFVAEVFTGSPGKLVDLADTIRGFKGLVEGKYDHLPEAAFYMVGTIEEAVDFYEDRFNLGLNAQEKSDLVAFLRAL